MLKHKSAWLLCACLSAVIFLWLADKGPSIDTAEQLELGEDKGLVSEQVLAEAVSEPEPPVPGDTGTAQQAHIALQVAQVLQNYDDISQYPSYSQPINSPEHLKAFVNVVKPQSSLPFPFPGLEQAIQAEVSLDEYNYFYGDEIRADIQLSALPVAASVTVYTQLMSLSGEVLAQSDAEMLEDQAQFKRLSALFNTKDYETQDWPLEMNLAALIEVDGHSIFISAPFRINKETAVFQSVGYSEVNSEHLVVPVNLDVMLPGYYFVSGVLYGGESGQALVYLEAEGALNEGLGSLALNAHIQALKRGGDEGPYELRDIRLERWSDETVPMDVAGKVPEEAFVVEGYRFEDFDDKTYEDPLKEERMRLMQGLSSR